MFEDIAEYGMYGTPNIIPQLANLWDNSTHQYKKTEPYWDDLADTVGLEEEQIERAIDIGYWAYINGVSWTELLSISDHSYTLFGVDPNNPFKLFTPNIALDFLTGKAYFSNAYVKGSVVHPSLVIDANNYTTYRVNEDGNSYLQLSDVTETNIYVYFFPSISYSSDLGYYYTYVALPEITEEMIGKEITICNATTDALSRTDLAMELRIISHGTISGTGLTVDLNDPKGLLVTRLSGSNQWSGAVPPYRTEVDALKVPLQHEVRLRAANKNMWVAVGTPYSIIGE